MSDKERYSKYGHLPGYQLAELIKNKPDWELDDDPDLGDDEFIDDLPLDDQAALFLQQNEVYESEHKSEDADHSPRAVEIAENTPSPYLYVDETLIGVDFQQVFKFLLPIIAGIRPDGAVYKNVASEDTLLQLIAEMAVDAGKPRETLEGGWREKWRMRADYACSLSVKIPEHENSKNSDIQAKKGAQDILLFLKDALEPMPSAEAIKKSFDMRELNQLQRSFCDELRLTNIRYAALQSCLEFIPKPCRQYMTSEEMFENLTGKNKSREKLKERIDVKQLLTRIRDPLIVFQYYGRLIKDPSLPKMGKHEGKSVSISALNQINDTDRMLHNLFKSLFISSISLDSYLELIDWDDALTGKEWKSEDEFLTWWQQVLNSNQAKYGRKGIQLDAIQQMHVRSLWFQMLFYRAYLQELLDFSWLDASAKHSKAQTEYLQAIDPNQESALLSKFPGKSISQIREARAKKLAAAEQNLVVCQNQEQLWSMPTVFRAIYLDSELQGLFYFIQMLLRTGPTDQTTNSVRAPEYYYLELACMIRALATVCRDATDVKESKDDKTEKVEHNKDNKQSKAEHTAIENNFYHKLISPELAKTLRKVFHSTAQQLNDHNVLAIPSQLPVGGQLSAILDKDFKHLLSMPAKAIAIRNLPFIHHFSDLARRSDMYIATRMTELNREGEKLFYSNQIRMFGIEIPELDFATISDDLINIAAAMLQIELINGELEKRLTKRVGKKEFDLQFNFFELVKSCLLVKLYQTNQVLVGDISAKHLQSNDFYKKLEKDTTIEQREVLQHWCLEQFNTWHQTFSQVIANTSQTFPPTEPPKPALSLVKGA
ncbi:hypothetical protein [Rheinheimera sp. F8]|uniref:hypothetical protein n=1 Tax=Rheinheimera sp. F8 TaxID=1763998 RepID=UPI00074482C5|nr:hypothetical protein [Rheinheimera sp. F8]ALZ76706.1 hypothetical protein ATY27_13690 [Rheinheimera sp. F8]